MDMLNIVMVGLEKGRKERENKFIISMYKKGYLLEQISDVVEKDIEEIKAIIEK